MRLQVAIELMVSLAVAMLLVSYALATSLGAYSHIGKLQQLEQLSCNALAYARQAYASCQGCSIGPVASC